MMNREKLKKIWQAEERKSFSGWDFSYLDGRYAEVPPNWDYRQKVLDFLKKDTKLLDMGTGGGEFLLSLRHPYALTSVTEGWKPNYELCMKKLSPLGITVAFADGEDKLPFENESFDLVINRHESYDIGEVRRVLKSNGFFITQQVGGKNNFTLSKRLLSEYKSQMPDFNLENEVPKWKNNGFRVMYKNQSYQKAVFEDVGAICYYAKILPWEFPDFSVENCFEELISLQANLDTGKKIETESHRFIIIAKKIGK